LVCMHNEVNITILWTWFYRTRTAHVITKFEMVKLFREPIFQYQTTKSWRNCLVLLLIHNFMAACMAMWHSM
jgi:hypothetical protein